MVDELETPPGQGRSEKIDNIFADSRLKLDEIISLLAQKLEEQLARLDLSDEAQLKRLDVLLNSLERLVFLGQMNRAKVRDLLHMAPKKYHRVLADEEIRRQLKPVRDEVNFPKRGPRGPREDVAEPAGGGFDPP